MKKNGKPLILALITGLIITTSCINIYNCDCDTESESESEIYKNQLILQPDSNLGKDTFIEDYPLREYRDRNFGTNREFQATAWTADGIPLVVRNLIDFDFSRIPKNIEISSAKLFLYAVDNTINGPGHSNRSGSNLFLLQRITSEWNELDVTWNTRPSTTTDSQVYVAGSEHYMQDYEIVITKLVRDILNNPSESHGLMIRLATEEYYRRVLFASSDHEDSTKHPKLVVEYN